MKKEIQKTQKVSIMTVRKPYNKRECRMSSEAKNKRDGYWFGKR